MRGPRLRGWGATPAAAALLLGWAASSATTMQLNLRYVPSPPGRQSTSPDTSSPATSELGGAIPGGLPRPAPAIRAPATPPPPPRPAPPRGDAPVATPVPIASPVPSPGGPTTVPGGLTPVIGRVTTPLGVDIRIGGISLRTKLPG